MGRGREFHCNARAIRRIVHFLRVGLGDPIETEVPTCGGTTAKKDGLCSGQPDPAVVSVDVIAKEAEMDRPVLPPPHQVLRDEAIAEVEVSVVMPCLDEARTVGRCVRKALAALDELGITGEVVVADNGSADGSPEAARMAGARVVSAERRGYGHTLQAGIAAARGRYVIMGDADDSYDFARIGPFIEHLRRGDDLVMGNRFRGGIRPRAMPWHHRYIGNPTLTGVLNLFFRSPIGDAHCGLRAVRKDTYQRLGLTSGGMEFASEMVVRACLNHLRISEVPVVLHPDGRDRQPHLRSFRDGWRHLRLLLLLCPTWLDLIPAGVLMGVGLALMVWLTPAARRVGSITLDVHTMLLGALWVLLGYQLLWMWIHAKTHGWASGLLPRDDRAWSVLDRIDVDRGLLVGVLLLLTGLGSNVWLVGEWYRREFGSLEVRATLPRTLWGLTTLMLGAQTVAGSFLLGMLRMPTSCDRRATSPASTPE